MKKRDHSINKSLDKSLTLISQSLIGSLGVSTILIIFNNDEKEVFTYTNKPLALSTFNYQEGILQDSLNSRALIATHNHPFQGIPAEIKFYASTPLTSSTRNKFGILCLLDEKERDFTSENNLVLENFMQIVSNTIENHLQNQKAQIVFTDFMHKAIHDLKNPLTSISLTSDLLTRKADDAKMVISFSERLEKANQRVFSNLEKLKSVFPITNDSFKLNIKEIRLSELFTDLKNTIAKAISIHSTTETSIYGDYDRLKEAIMFLISHSSLATEQEVKLKCYEKNSSTVIEICCKQTENSSSTALTISNTLIEMHKGKIEIDESSYYICLPLETP